MAQVDTMKAQMRNMQMQCVEMFAKGKGLIPKEQLNDEIDWFFHHLGLDETLFESQPPESISKLMMLLYSAKVSASIRNSEDLDVNLRQEMEESALYMVTSKPESKEIKHFIERRVDEKYIDSCEARKQPFCVESYLSAGSVTSSSENHIRCFLLHRCKFAVENPREEDAKDISKVCDEGFTSRYNKATQARIEQVMLSALQTTGSVIEVDTIPDSEGQRLLIAYKRGTTEKYFAAITDLLLTHGFYSMKKYVENFSNRITMFVVYVVPIKSQALAPGSAMSQVMKELSMLYTISTSPLHEMFLDQSLAAQEMVYGTAAAVFAQHFLNRLGKEYWSIKDQLDPENQKHQQVLNMLRRRLRSETFTSEYILDIIRRYPQLVKRLYVHFAVSHYVKPKRDSVFSITFISLKEHEILTDDELLDYIKTTVSNEHEKAVFESFLQFNNACTKTNFYNPSKIALSFRLDPKFLSKEEYPLPPYCMYLVVGNEFRGFHIRFTDIARGGIRIIRSRNPEIYSANKRTLFDENYALASTQNRKNKDIPEGGSKGTILLDRHQQDKAKESFEKYIDALMDLLVESQQKIRGRRNSTHNKENPEILFFGPDEGTADFMDWASLHAKARGLSYWKAITTGKSQSLGGIPHDIYGMTTRSVHRNVEGIYAMLGLDETAITKFQTGGPDGDLGSNEILISKDKTIAIVDGSGVVYDPCGLDREEITRLAKARKMIVEFDTAKLSAKGFQVLVDDKIVELPDGTIVKNGLEFRNTFHLNPLSSADLFVPCGGRPEAVDINNYQHLLREDGVTPRFKYIVEGANLFFTQDARIRLEKAGCVIIKDASANKGGVTSSSLEVLAALALNDEDFAACMTVKEGVVPQFYKDYVKEVHEIIERNADMEFECMWKEKLLHPNKTRADISDELSLAIVELKGLLQQENALWRSEIIRPAVFSLVIPKMLQEKAGGLEKLIDRLPDNYLRAIFASFMASKFVYSYGAHPKRLAFFDYVTKFIMSLEESSSDDEQGPKPISNSPEFKAAQ